VKLGLIVKAGVIGQVENIYPQRGGVALDRSGFVHWLDRVRELEEELDQFKQVFHLAGGWGRQGGTGGDELDRKVRGEEVM
jgi:hypothetical protein